MNRPVYKRIIISGGARATCLSAVAIAGALRRIDPGVEILFVGAEGRMEMKKPCCRLQDHRVLGRFHRRDSQEFHGYVKLFQKHQKGKEDTERVQTDVVVGVGGYASGPVRGSRKNEGPCLIQEQTVMPNNQQLLARRVQRYV